MPGPNIGFRGARGLGSGGRPHADVRRYLRLQIPETEKERSTLDFPQEWMTPVPSRRPDIFPEFERLKHPDPKPMPGDPELPDEEELEEVKESHCAHSPSSQRTAPCHARPRFPRRAPRSRRNVRIFARLSQEERKRREEPEPGEDSPDKEKDKDKDKKKKEKEKEEEEGDDRPQEVPVR